MSELQQPVYVSQATGKNLWQEYRIYPDRIELDVQVWGTVRIPFDGIDDVAVRPPVVVLDVARGEYGLGEILRSPKLDLADLHEHVAIEKSSGLWRQFRITPDDPEAFQAAFRAAFAAWRASR